jgi:hypothetical protein
MAKCQTDRVASRSTGLAVSSVAVVSEGVVVSVVAVVSEGAVVGAFCPHPANRQLIINDD